VPTMSSLPQCTRCGLKAAQGGRSKCANCGFAYGQQFEQSKGTTSGPVTPSISELPTCKRCGTRGKLGHKNCVFCGLTYGTEPSTSDKKTTGTTQVAKSQLPKCSQCGSWGKLNTDKCPFCYKPYTDADLGSSSTSTGKKTCNRCGSKGIRDGDLKCAYCGFTFGEAWSGPMVSVSTSSSTTSDRLLKQHQKQVLLIPPNPLLPQPLDHPQYLMKQHRTGILQHLKIPLEDSWIQPKKNKMLLHFVEFVEVQTKEASSVAFVEKPIKLTF